jgi:UDP-N-acetylglucosamine--N-acetylmuramyl-(pentapeptide) pyrophosphoryl-undecaprenol N-acetylglucosamine transferase
MPNVAIACGGTGGHLFPGLAVARELLRRHCAVSLLISPKEVDQQAVRSARDMEIVTLPAVGLSRGAILKFAGGFVQSYRAAKRFFTSRPPHAVLAMGGFTAAPPVLAGRKFGAKTFLHESNAIPGRANSWLANFVDQGFVYFHAASGRMNLARIEVTGMPVREEFSRPLDAAAARTMLGLDPHKPVLLVMGGSQGAGGINDLVVSALPRLADVSNLQILHLTGARDFEKINAACAGQKLKASVRAFLTEMELALRAATVAVSRAGASSLAEIAAVGVPSILIPFPAAADNHQFYNAEAFAESGAAVLLEQSHLTPEKLAGEIIKLIGDDRRRAGLQQALSRWHTPRAAEIIATHIIKAIAQANPEFEGMPAVVRARPGFEIPMSRLPAEVTRRYQQNKPIDVELAVPAF